MEKLNVLIVDDKLPILNAFSVLFKLLNIDATITFAQPTAQSKPLGGTPMPAERQLDKFDIALLDLELFNPRNRFGYDAKDLMGGSSLLPYLRKHAPWLPVVAQSILFTAEAPHLLTHVGAFGFDGLLPQSMLPLDTLDDNEELRGLQILDRAQWRTLATGALRRRREALFGPGYAGISSVPSLDIAGAVERALGEKLAAFRAMVNVAFHFASDIAIEEIAPGHSGARVYKAVVSGGAIQGARHGYWLVKTSESPSKLSAEASHHLAMMLSGAEYGVAVPLLWRGVLVEQRQAMIAYRFADGTLPASQAASGALTSVRPQLERLLQRFYSGGASTAQANRDTLLKKFGPWLPNLKAVAGRLPDEFRPFAAALLDEDSMTFAKVVPYTQCRIHGDLHLDNIMVGDLPVLIDFSKTEIGPVAADAAKLAADMLLRRPELRGETLPKWRDSSKLFDALGEVAAVFQMQDHDHLLFSDFIALHVWEALYFDGTPPATQEWILEVLRRSPSAL